MAAPPNRKRRRVSDHDVAKVERELHVIKAGALSKGVSGIGEFSCSVPALTPSSSSGVAASSSSSGVGGSRSLKRVTSDERLKAEIFGEAEGDDAVQSLGEIRDIVRKELDQYRLLPRVVDETTNPYDWWSHPKQVHRFGALAPVMRNVFSAPASSA